MTIYNQTRQTILSSNAIKATSLKDQALGLLAHKKPIAMILKSRWGIHTFLMKYPIDVLILDGENRVVAMKENMKPNDIFLWNPRYNTIVELPGGTIEKTSTNLGDNVKLL